MLESQEIRFSVVFVLGGPGSGKGTQCQALAARGLGNPNSSYQFVHLGIGDILRAEIKRPESKHRTVIEENMRSGRIGPKEITIELLIAAMLQALPDAAATATSLAGETIFLIDGFPRKMDQALLFEQKISQPLGVIVFNVAEDKQRVRLKQRAIAEGRFDDNDDTIPKRIATFHKVTSNVLSHYDDLGRLHVIDANPSPEEVYIKLASALSTILDNR